MFEILQLKNGVGAGLSNDEEDVAATDQALRDIGAYVPPEEYAAEPQRFATAPMLQALKRVQEQNGIKIDGVAFPGGPTERAINNRLADKPRGAGLLHSPDARISAAVGNGFDNLPRDVRTVKRVLGAMEYLPEDPFDIPSDFIDEATIKSLKRFQVRHQLCPDGWLAPGGETEAALQDAAARLLRANGSKWRNFWRSAPYAPLKEGTDESNEGGATKAEHLQYSPASTPARQATRSTNEDSARQNQESGSQHALPRTLPQSAASEVDAPLGRVGVSDTRSEVSSPDRTQEDDPRHFEHPPNPETNLGSWSFKPEAVLPEGIKPPSNPLKRDVVGTVPFEGGGEFDTGIDRRREIRFLITRLYRVGAVDANGRFRLSDEDFEKYIASAADHIEPEYAPIFELTARAVRAGALEWHVAATRLAAYYAPRKSGEGVIDFILDLTPVVGQIKAVKELVEGVQDAIDARAYGDQRAFDSAIEKAAGAGISLLGGVGIAGAGARQLARELHHIIPLYLGGFQNSPTIELSRFLHRTLHRRMQAHFNTVERGLAHRSGYGRLRIQEIFVPQKRLEALDQFYRTLERSRWTSLRKAAEEWRKIFPEAAKYIK